MSQCDWSRPEAWDALFHRCPWDPEYEFTATIAVWEDSSMNTIRDPEQLRQFFAAKGQRNLVLRVADVLDMEPADMALVLRLAGVGNDGWHEYPEGTRRALQRLGAPAGYILLPLDVLCARLSLDDLEALQGWLETYRDIRRRKGHGLVIEPDGKTVLRDMTAEEWALATKSVG